MLWNCFLFLFHYGFIDFTIFFVYIWSTTVFNINKHSTRHPVNHCPSKVGIIVNIITGFVTLLFEEWNNYKSWNVVKLIIVWRADLITLSHWYLSGNKIHHNIFKLLMKYNITSKNDSWYLFIFRVLCKYDWSLKCHCCKHWLESLLICPHLFQAIYWIDVNFISDSLAWFILPSY